MNGVCPEISRLIACCEEAKPVITLSKREAEALIEDHLSLLREVMQARKSIRGMLKYA